ncbi:hypothetical protein, partial [Xanthomonas oryzae]|uniref:hypothetical protein n=1 Tax=Xanthomonas oryzae TaxID=347 RepID=UPI001C4A0068
MVILAPDAMDRHAMAWAVRSDLVGSCASFSCAFSVSSTTKAAQTRGDVGAVTLAWFAKKTLKHRRSLAMMH